MRCNVGVNPNYLTDQHLIAEYRELLIVPGMLSKQGNVIKSVIPGNFTLNKGHINFFKNKLIYLRNRWDVLREEMLLRQFKPTIVFPQLSQFPEELLNDWVPSQEDSNIVRQRIFEKIEGKFNWYRFNHSRLDPYFLTDFMTHSLYKF